MMKNCVIYARNSTHKQSIDKTHELQIHACQKYAEYHNLKIKKVFVDEAKTGTNTFRPQLQTLLQYIHDHQVNFVLISKIDRFARSLIDLKQLVDQLFTNNTALIVVEQQLKYSPDTNDPVKNLLFNILGIFAEFEAQLIRDRLIAGRERARREGTKSGKPLHRPTVELPQKELVHDYLVNRMSISALSRKYKVSRQTINRRLKEWSIK